METDYTLLFAIIALLLSLFITIFGLLVHSGLFREIEIRAGKPSFENLVVAYKFSRGPYKNCGGLFTEAHALIPELRTIGVYYDDPAEVEPASTRYIVGLITAEGDKTTSPEHEQLLQENGYKFVNFPATSHAISATFPFKNTVSIFLSVFRVYPKLNDYIRSRQLNAHPMMEIYSENTIYFLAPLARQEEFYVPETREEAYDDGDTGSASPSSGEEDQSQHSPGGKPRKHSLSQHEEEQEGKLRKDSSESSFEELNVDS